MSHNDILIVEYYDQLPTDWRKLYRAEGTWADHVDDIGAVAAEFDRIEAGRKAACLS